MSAATALGATLRRSDVALGGGQTMRVVQAGDTAGPAVLFIHGADPGVTAESTWGALIAALGPDTHCIAPDLLGFGNSSHPDPPPLGFGAGVETAAAAVVELVDAMGLAPLTVVGTSLGGTIALRVAALAPESVRTVALIATGGLPGLPPNPAMVALAATAENPTAEGVAAVLDACLYDTSALPIYDLIRDRTAIAVRPQVRRSLQALFAPSPPLEVTSEQLSALPQPALVIHGREDQVVPLEASFYLAGNIPDADLYVLPHCGHFPQLEHPTQVAGAIADFVDIRTRRQEAGQR